MILNSTTNCILNLPRQVNIPVHAANLTGNDYGVMSVACPVSIPGRLRACVDVMSSPDAQICEYYDGSDKCSAWTSGCILLKEYDGEETSFNLRVKASEVGVKCVLLEQLQNGGDRGQVSTVNILAADMTLDEMETAMFIAHALLVCFMNFFVGKRQSLFNLVHCHLMCVFTVA